MGLLEHLELSVKISEAGGKFLAPEQNGCACHRRDRTPQTFSVPLSDPKPEELPVIACARCDSAQRWPRFSA